jgi:uncharacterized membrane protein
MLFSNLIKDKYLRVIAIISFLVLFLAAIIFYLTLGSTPTPIIIHFNEYNGIDFLGSRWDVFGILLSALVMILINLFLANFLYNRERFLSYIFVFGCLLISILILVVISVIINVN